MGSLPPRTRDRRQTLVARRWRGSPGTAPTSRVRPLRRWRRRACCLIRGAVSLTRTGSRFCASASSSRCSASTRPQARRTTMSSPFLAEIRIWGSNFAPKGWAFCDGQALPISQNTALFSLLGTYYGGDGKSNFKLPNLDGSSPMFFGQSQGGSLYDLGEDVGQQAVTLLESEVPPHQHALQAEPRPANLVTPRAANSARRAACVSLDIALLPKYGRTAIGPRPPARSSCDPQPAGKPVQIHAQQPNPALR